MKFLARYVAYLAFVVAALAFWIVFAYVFLGASLLPGDPACHFEQQGCPKPSMLAQAVRAICFFSALPLTAIAFVAFRKAVRRGLGMSETRSTLP